MDNLFELPSQQFAKRLLKEYDEGKHPRDTDGKWTSGGGGGGRPARPRKEPGAGAWDRAKEFGGHALRVGGALAAGAVGIPLAIGGGITAARALRHGNIAASPLGRAARAVGRQAFRTSVRGQAATRGAVRGAVSRGVPAGIGAVNRASRAVGSRFRIR